MARVRAFVEEDVQPVTALHRRAFPESSRGIVANDLRAVFLEGPWADPACPSLVAEDARGIAGFLGVVRRPMTFEGRPISVAATSQFMVDPDRRGPTALWLLQRLIAGPQDLTVADEASASSTAVWRALGGEVSPLHGLRWIRILRPCRFGVSALAAARGGALVARALGPLCALPDVLLSRARSSPLRCEAPPRGEAAALTTDACLRILAATAGDLAPRYDRRSLEWLFGMLHAKRCHGALSDAAFVDGTGGGTGAYLSFARPNATAEVALLCARGFAFGRVWDHLIHDARRRGDVAIAGRFDPRYVGELAARRCIFTRGRGAFLFHSRDAGLRRAIGRGQVPFGRLDGEWWMRFLCEPDSREARRRGPARPAPTAASRHARANA